MLYKKSERSSLLKLLALIPIVGLALVLNARTVTDYVYDEPQKQQPVKKGKKAGTIKVNGQEIKVVEQDDIVTMEGEEDQDQAKEEAFDVVEEMPEFPGGPKALMDYLMTNVKYPKTAFDANIQGRVIAQFVVDKEGTVRDAHVVKSVDPALDAEALRVINNMPKWRPGRQNGKVVNVKYTIPVNFNLQGDDKKENTEVGLNVTPDGARSNNPSGNIQIRYAGTTRDPLFIVDGVKTSAEKVKAMDAKTIDRMEVLNDKSAVEKYGDEAKGGVIIITTKK
jgi:TonB family protein